MGDQAVWSLSTAKPGNGVDQLRDDNSDTYWQSDGPQPHLVNIQFHSKMRLHEIRIYTDFKLDESYTPSKISIRAGTTFHDLQEIHVQELNEPSGWVTILPPPDAEGAPTRSARRCARPTSSRSPSPTTRTARHAHPPDQDLHAAPPDGRAHVPPRLQHGAVPAVCVRTVAASRA